jgi:predicted amidohydrolase
METTIATCAFPGTYDVDKNVELLITYLDEAARAGATLAVFPECCLQGYPADFRASSPGDALDRFYATAEPVAAGAHVAQVVAAAAERGVWVVFGLNEATARPGVVYNTMVLAGPDGIAGTYRKVHVTITEQVFWRRGDDWPVLQTPFGRVGMLICYDKAWPEACRELTLRGADLLVMSTAWPRQRPGTGDEDIMLEHYRLYDRVRAMENSRWFVSSNLVGELGGLEFFGLSQVVDPLGHVVARTAVGEAGLVVATIDLAAGVLAAARVNQGSHLVRDRRPETYRALAGSLPIAVDG